VRITEMIVGLADAGVDFVLIGGVAAGVHGSTRVTFDLDICYSPEPENRRRLATLLTEWDAYLRGVEPGLPFVMDDRTLETSPVLTLTTRLGALDVLDAVQGVGPYPEVVKQSVKAEFAGRQILVLDLPGLLKAKRATKRPRDAEQIPELEALLALRRRRQ
jgi:hypothetical protein